jgi:hypothetical protein
VQQAINTLAHQATRKFVHQLNATKVQGVQKELHVACLELCLHVTLTCGYKIIILTCLLHTIHELDQTWRGILFLGHPVCQSVPPTDGCEKHVV